VAGFSELFRSEQCRLERLAAISEPLRQPQGIFQRAESRKGLEVEDVASLLAVARNHAQRIEIREAAERIRARWAKQAVEFIIPVYLTSFCQNQVLVCR